MKILHLFLVLTSILFFQCKSAKDKVGDNKVAVIVYAYEVGPCFGTCPIFKIEIDHQGKVYYDAKKFNKINGRLERQLTKEEFSSIKKAFDKADLFKLQDNYPTIVADLPSIKVTHIKDGVKKTVKASEKMPQPFEQLLVKLNELVQKDGWILIEKYEDERPEPKKEDDNIYEEIIVSFKQGTRLPQWFKDNEQTTIRLMKAVSAETNSWLVTYDKMKFEPYAMLEKLRKDPAVKQAEFNKKIANR